MIENPDFQAFCRNERPYVCIPNAFQGDSTTFLQDLKWDATILKLNGFGATAGIASTGGGRNGLHDALEVLDCEKKQLPLPPAPPPPAAPNEIIRKNVHQIWLSSPGNTVDSNIHLQNVFCGNMDARRSLLRHVEQLACAIQEAAAAGGRDPSFVEDIGDDGDDQYNTYTTVSPEVPPELSYLLYEPGAYYQRHVDLIQKHQHQDNKALSQRVVSMILYLGHDKDDVVPYDEAMDGGSLRIYRQQEQPSEVHPPTNGKWNDGDDVALFEDILPLSNTLVLLDSATVSHEVLETLNRSRICVVGWFHGVSVP